MEAEAVVVEAGSPAAMDTAIATTTTTTTTTATTAMTPLPFTNPAKVPIAGKISISSSSERQIITSSIAITQKPFHHIKIMFSIERCMMVKSLGRHVIGIQEFGLKIWCTGI
jgi:hypothetical protein